MFKSDLIGIFERTVIQWKNHIKILWKFQTLDHRIWNINTMLDPPKPTKWPGLNCTGSYKHWQLVLSHPPLRMNALLAMAPTCRFTAISSGGFSFCFIKGTTQKCIKNGFQFGTCISHFTILIFFTTMLSIRTTCHSLFN